MSSGVRARMNTNFLVIVIVIDQEILEISDPP